MNISVERAPFFAEAVKVRTKEGKLTREQVLLRIGAVCAVLGAVVSVAAGIGFGNLTNDSVIEAVLSDLSARPRWYWPAVHMGFMLGAVLWVGAFTSLAASLDRSESWALGKLGVVSIVLGAALHITDSSINGFGLAALAEAWAEAPSPDRQSIVSIGDTLLRILNGTGSSVVGLFHGLPFVLMGLAVARSRSYPDWLGWAGVIGGVGSFVVGVLMFLNADFIPAWLFIILALVVSVWMVAIGGLMWRRAAAI